MELYHEQTLDDTGTKIFDLNFKDPLSSLDLKFQGVNGATKNQANYMHDVITKIELVDGSDLITSLSLKELQAFQAYQTGIYPVSNFEENASKGGRDNAAILFGRYLWDKEYWLDLSKFRNPQLKITTDEDVIHAMGTNGWLTGNFKMSVVAHIIEDGAKDAKGFLMQKELYSFTSVASGDEHVDLPIDHPYLGLMVMSTIRTCTDLYELISQIKLSCDSDKFIPIDRYVHDLMHEQSKYSNFYMDGVWFRKGEFEPVIPIAYNARFAAFPYTYDRTLAMVYPWSGLPKFRSGIATTGAATTSEEEIFFSVRGSSPHKSLFIPMGMLDDIESYFDVKAWNEIKLILTQAAAGAIKVCAQQLRSYA
jgi:hypothetical protein